MKVKIFELHKGEQGRRSAISTAPRCTCGSGTVGMEILNVEDGAARPVCRPVKTEERAARDLVKKGRRRFLTYELPFRTNSGLLKQRERRFRDFSAAGGGFVGR